MKEEVETVYEKPVTNIENEPILFSKLTEINEKSRYELFVVRDGSEYHLYWEADGGRYNKVLNDEAIDYGLALSYLIFMCVAIKEGNIL